MTAEAAPTTYRVVDLEGVRLQDREEMWRIVAAPHFDMTDLPVEVRARGVAYYLGPVTLTRSRHPEQTLIRTTDRARRDGADDLFCSMELEGAFRATIGEAVLDVDPGRVSLWDLSRPSAKYCQAGETLCLRIDRDAWRRAVGGDPPVHGMTLGPLGPLFRDHLLSLERLMSSEPERASPTLGQATLTLLAACVSPERSREFLQPVRPKVLSLLLERVERYIKANLKDPTLSPERVAHAVGVSRSSLYMLMKDAGGVAGYLRRCRLEAAHGLLAKGRGVRVGDIALEVGFSGQTQFNRAFKEHFGYTPGEVRELGP